MLAFGFFIVIACIFGSAIVVLIDILLYLKSGVWMSMPVALVFYLLGVPFPTTPGWHGLQKIIDWILAAPLAGFLFFLGTGLGLLLFWLAEQFDSQQPNRRYP